MAEYYADYKYITQIKNVFRQLKVVEEPDVSSRKAKLKISIIRTNNSNDDIDIELQEIKITLNGETVYNHKTNFPALKKGSTDEKDIIIKYVDYNSVGTGTFKIKIDHKCEPVISSIPFIGEIWGTTASAEISESLTPIDLSSPKIQNIITTSNRYGTGVSIAFNASHKSYPVTSIKFTLFDLTDDQSYYRVGKETQADSYRRSKVTSTSYNLVLEKTKSLLLSNEIFFNLDDYRDGRYPLDSGKSYKYEIIIAAKNGISSTFTGWIDVPQKVTGISCENSIDFKIGESEKLQYIVLPTNAELQKVYFLSSNPEVAMVSETGLITAKDYGQCIVSVITEDGGYCSECTISVYNLELFPKLTEIRYLTEKEIRKISSACNFIRGKLLNNGIEVIELKPINCTGKSHNVTKIKSLLEAIETNCQTLKASATTAGVVTESLPSPQTILKQNINWYIVINEWIAFLNELNEKLN